MSEDQYISSDPTQHAPEVDTPKLLSVVVPVYNERLMLRASIDRFVRTPLPIGLDCEIILVDDGSSDGSGQIAQQLHDQYAHVRLIRRATNGGKGAALRDGFEAAKGDIVMVHDADMEYDPADYADALQPILDGKADVVFGSRFLGGRAHRVLYYWHSVANRVITTWSNVLTNLNMSDIECCTKIFTRKVLDKLEIEERSFGVEPELVAKCARMRLVDGESPTGVRPLRIYEVPVSYAGRTYAEGKKIRWQHGFEALVCTVKYGAL